MKDSLQTGDGWFRAAADASLDALFVAKGVRDEAGQLVDFECIDVNGTALAMLGVTREKVIGEKLWGLLPLNREANFDKYAQVVATGSALEEEIPIDTPESKAKWLRQQVVRVGDGIAISARYVTHWKESGARPKESEARLHLATEAAHMGAWTWEPKTDRFSFSEGMGAVFGLPRGEGFHTPEEIIQAVYPADRDIVARALLQGRETGTSARVEVRTIWPDGTLRWVQAESNFIRDATGAVEHGVGIAMDITERKKADQAQRILNRALKTLSSCNEVLARMTDEATLLHQVCRVIVEVGGYNVASVGYARDDDEKSIEIMACHGHDRSVLDVAVPFSWADNEVGRGPHGRAIRTGAPQLVRHAEKEPDQAPWRGVLVAAGASSEPKPGIWSELVLPMCFDSQRPFGALFIASTEVDVFDEAEMKLLAELADDLAFGIHMLRARADHERAVQTIRDSEERFRSIFEHTREVIYVIGPDGKFVSLSPAFATVTGWSTDEWVGKPFLPIVHPDEMPRALEVFDETISMGRSCQFEMRMARKTGGYWDGDFSVGPLQHGGTTMLLGIAHDVTERKAAESEIARLNRVYVVLSRINALSVRVSDRDELFREACQIAVEHGGFRMSLIAIVDRAAAKIVPVASAGKDEELLGAINSLLSSSELASATMVARAIRAKEAIVSNDSQNDPQVLLGKKYAESGVRSMAVLPLIVADEAVGVLTLYASEMAFFQEAELKLLTELTGDIAFAIDYIEKQARLDYLAYYDVLTGLANRALFLERVAQYLRSAATGGHKLAMVLIDLERFKNINDSLGRSVGDALLRQVAEWLKQSTGDASLLARIGADHFAVVQMDIQSKEDLAQLVDERMEAFLQHPFLLDGAVFRFGFRAGVTLFPDDGADADTLFKNAEAALKKAKASGERYLFYTQRMTDAVAGKVTLENQLRQALANEEFLLHYQPKVNLTSGKLAGAEALIRWNDPRTGLVPPARFIPILEETGLIYDVGRWALRKAIEDYLRWRAAGTPPVRIAVNVSPLQLRNRGFVDEIKRMISIDAHAAAGLELEITESLIMENVKYNIASLQAIRDLGVTIAIDDFGTGFSSLSYLAKMPVDTLKIDRSFVVDMTIAPEGLALVSTIINLAHSLKLKVVAEGVETEEQSRLLRLLNCDEMQGFLFSSPVPAEIFETRFLTPPPAG